MAVTNKCNTTLRVNAIYAFGGESGAADGIPYGGADYCDNQDAARSGTCVERLTDVGGLPGNYEEGFNSTYDLAPGRVATSGWYTAFGPTLYLGATVITDAGAPIPDSVEVDGQPSSTFYFQEDGTTPCTPGETGCMDQPYMLVGAGPAHMHLTTRWGQRRLLPSALCLAHVHAAAAWILGKAATCRHL